MSYAARKAELREQMRAIREELDRMAIHRGDLIWEYQGLNHEIGRIEYEEHALANHKPQANPGEP